jgi:hypothetical protein
VSWSVTEYAVLIRGDGVANSLYARSSCEIIVGLCCLGLPRGISGNDVVLVGLAGRAVDTLGDGDVGATRFVTLGVGSSTIGVGACCGVILLKIADNSLIACILSDPGCLNGVAGTGCMISYVADMVVASALDRPGTLQCCGVNLMVSTIRSCPVVAQ